MTTPVSLTETEWALFFEQVVPYYGLDTSFMWHEQPAEAARYLATYAAAEGWEDQTAKVGDLFLNKFPELDGADSSEIGVNRFVNRDGERWTPARSVWRVDSLNGHPEVVVTIICEETGAAINPTLDELLDPDNFTRV